MFPVDLPDVEDLASASERCLSALKDECFSSHSAKVPIRPENIIRLRLFEDDQPACFVLALHPPDDPATVLALYLQDTWWALDDVLRTSCHSRRGLVSVRSMTERLIVFLLSQVVERLPAGEALFSPHPRTESCKVLWSAGEAVGFYTVKRKGSLCGGWSSSSYVLPVLDSLQVRSSCRRRGFGLLMVDDFCSSFSTQEVLGISSPLSPNMAAVLLKFLRRRAEQRERLYEVEAPGGWSQRRNIWLGLQLGRYARGERGVALQGGGAVAGSAPSGCCDGGVMSEEDQEQQDQDQEDQDQEDQQEEEVHDLLQENRTLDVAPLSTGPQAQPDPIRSGRMSGTGSGSAAHAGRSDSPSSEPPPPPPPPARRRSEDPEERTRTSKRARRT